MTNFDSFPVGDGEGDPFRKPQEKDKITFGTDDQGVGLWPGADAYDVQQPLPKPRIQGLFTGQGNAGLGVEADVSPTEFYPPVTDPTIDDPLTGPRIFPMGPVRQQPPEDLPGPQ